VSWQDIILTPLFWMVATTGTVVLSIAANLLTPFVSAFVTRHLHARQSGVRKKQIHRRDQVLILQANLSRRTGAKLDVIFKLLLVLVSIVVCVFLFQLGSGSLQISAPSTPSMQLQLPTLLIILLGLIFAIALGKLGLDDMALALAADRRERASDDFLKQHRPASAEERKHFEDDWDLREFGVNSQDVDPTSIEERA
jgi:hypothetical protein